MDIQLFCYKVFLKLDLKVFMKIVSFSFCFFEINDFLKSRSNFMSSRSALVMIFNFIQ